MATILIASISSFYSHAKTIEGSFVPSETTDLINDKVRKFKDDNSVTKYTINSDDDIDNYLERGDFLAENDYVYSSKTSNILLLLDASPSPEDYRSVSAGAKKMKMRS